MLILTISGSPRKNGNTETLLNHAMNYLKKKDIQTKSFYISEKNVSPCLGCDACNSNNNCKIDDDMIQLYDYLDKCDAILIGSPVYMGNITAQLKAIFDRFYAVKFTRPLEGKLVGAMVVGRGTGGVALADINRFCLSKGATCLPVEGNNLPFFADKPGEIANQPDALKKIGNLCDNIIKLLKR